MDDPFLFKDTKWEKIPKKILAPSVADADHQLNNILWLCCHVLSLGPLCFECCGLLVGGPLWQPQKCISEGCFEQDFIQYRLFHLQIWILVG